MILTQQDLARMIDLSAVRAECDEAEIRELAAVARRFGVVCVFAMPCHTRLLASLLATARTCSRTASGWMDWTAARRCLTCGGSRRGLLEGRLTTMPRLFQRGKTRPDSRAAARTQIMRLS